MKNLFKGKKIYKKILLIVVLGYAVYIFVSQQKLLNTYKSSQQYYSKQLSEQLAYHETLTTTKDNIDSPEYIEEIAREKLDMYFPNETVYIDKSK